MHRRGRSGDLRLLAGQDRFERRFETGMGVFQRLDAGGKNIVLIENLLHRARLFARELSIDIGYEQFVAEFGHGLSPSG